MRNIFNWNKQNTKACSWIHPGILHRCTFYTYHLMAVLNNLNHSQTCLAKPVSRQCTITFDNCYSYPAEKTSMGFQVGQQTIFLEKLVKKPGGDTSIQNTTYYWWPAIHGRHDDVFRLSPSMIPHFVFLPKTLFPFTWCSLSVPTTAKGMFSWKKHSPHLKISSSPKYKTI